MWEIQVLKKWLMNHSDQFINDLMNSLDDWENKVGAKELASIIQSLLSAKTLNSKWDEMMDNKVILDTVKLVLQLNWIKTWNTVNVNLFNIQKPWKDDVLGF